jgi:glycerol-1-phosphate dehydrogenase [NAD(P)+]
LAGYPRGEAIRLRRMLFAGDAVHSLPEVLRSIDAPPSASLQVVLDPVPMRRGPDDLKPLVLSILQAAGWAVERVVVEPDASGQIHTDFEQIERVQSRLIPGCAVMAVGSGTITDIAKHACHQSEQATGIAIPFLVYQTANSVSAFTSNMAPTFVHGVKRTLPSRYPDALVCDLETLRDAPYVMTAAGVGDLLAAGVSFADWYLAYRLGMDDSYTALAETLMGSVGDELLELAPAIRTRELEAMGALAKWIALAGLAMSLSHATTPLSGFEHVFSHVIDMTADSRSRPLAMHGAQVALTAGIASSAYAVLLREFAPSAADLARCFPEDATMHRRVAAAFSAIEPSGQVAEECWADYRVKLQAWCARQDLIRGQLRAWPDLRAELQARAWPASKLWAIARAAGLPQDFGALTPPVSDADAREAFLTAHLIRRRFTIGDLLVFLGWDRAALWGEIKPQSV